MPAIVLAALNARYTHPATGLYCLLANLGDLAAEAEIRECTIHDPPAQVAERLLAGGTRLVALSVSVWSRAPALRMLRILRAVAPQVTVVLGGPEVSHHGPDDPLVQLADVVIAGEGERAFPPVCRELLARSPGPRPPPRILRPAPPDLADLALPYGLYPDHDLAHRLVYVESARGCPFTCAFCLSARDERVRRFPPERFLAAMERLLERGCRCFKFLDRSFNLDEEAACRVLGFFRERWRDGLFLHLEMVPDRLPMRLRDLLAGFPAGGIQLEIGIQSFTPAVLAGIGRRMDLEAACANLAWLRARTGCHLHVDLIAGLPGESWGTLAASFDRLWSLRPHEIQFGILKRLEGAPLAAVAARDGLIFDPEPPYELLASPGFTFADMQRLKRLARTLEVYGNRGRFRDATAAMVGTASAFAAWLALADRLHAEEHADHGQSLDRQHAFLLRHLTAGCGLGQEPARALLRGDFLRQGSERHLPTILR